MTNYLSRYNLWLESDKVAQEDKDFLISIKNDEDEIKKCFSEYMSFGTAGLRSTMGPGISKMNVYTVAHTTQAIAELIKEEKKEIESFYSDIADYATEKLNEVIKKQQSTKCFAVFLYLLTSVI